MAITRAKIWRVVLTVALAMVGAVGYAQVDASALMRAQRQGQNPMSAGYGQILTIHSSRMPKVSRLMRTVIL